MTAALLCALGLAIIVADTLLLRRWEAAVEDALKRVTHLQTALHDREEMLAAAVAEAERLAAALAKTEAANARLRQVNLN